MSHDFYCLTHTKVKILEVLDFHHVTYVDSLSFRSLITS